MLEIIAVLLMLLWLLRMIFSFGRGGLMPVIVAIAVIVLTVTLLHGKHF